MADPLAASGQAQQSIAEIRDVMNRYNRRLYRVAWSILRDEASAEDAVQESYLQYFRHRSSFRQESDLGTWLTRIAINQALMQRRRQRPAIALDAAEPTAEILLHPALVTSDDPEKLAARRELRLLIETAIAELAEPFRLVFILREVEGLSGEEAAAVLGITPETVRTRLHRAKQRLRTLLDREIASSLTDSFPFAGVRCTALSERVLSALQAAGLAAQA